MEVFLPGRNKPEAFREINLYKDFKDKIFVFKKKKGDFTICHFPVKGHFNNLDSLNFAGRIFQKKR